MEKISIGGGAELEEKHLQQLEAEKRVKGLLSLMIDKLGVDIPESARPAVKISPKGYPTSAYDQNNNVIYILNDHLESGITYGEELGHFIRCYLCQLNNDEDIEDQPSSVAVNEFFGRVGENLAREVAKGTKFEDLFDENERHHFEDEELLTDIRLRTEQLRPVVEGVIVKIEKQSAFKLEAIKKIKAFYSKVEEAQAMCKEAEAQKISPIELAKNIVTFLDDGSQGRKELIEFIKTTKDGEDYPKWVGNLLKIIETVNYDLRRIIELSSDHDLVESSEIYSLFLTTSGFTKQVCDFELFNLAGPNLDLLVSISNLKSELYHIVGYAAAEHFMISNPGWLKSVSQIFNVSNEEALDKFINSEGFKEWAINNKELEGLAILLEKLKELNKKMQIPTDENIDNEG